MKIEYYYRIMTRNAGVDTSQVKEVPIKVDMPRFFSDEVHVWSGYSLNEPLAAQERNIPVQEIFCENWGVPAVGDTIFTTERLIRNNPRKVISFVQAAIQGWTYAIQHPDEAVADIRSHGATKWQLLTKLEVPHCLPDFFASLRVGATLRVIGAIVAELAGAKKGLGFLVLYTSMRVDTLQLFGAIFFRSVLGFLLYGIVAGLDKLVVTRMGMETIRE